MVFLSPPTSSRMNAYGVVRVIVLGVFSVVKFVILSVLRLGRWCRDRIHVN